MPVYLKKKGIFTLYLAISNFVGYKIVTAQQQPQQQNKHNCSWVETKQLLRTATTQTESYLIKQK